MKKIRLFVLGLIVIGSQFFAGCPKKTDGPNPSDTVMGASGPREDWINASDASYAEGLQPRESALLEGKTPHQVYASVYFDFDDFSIKPAERSALDGIATYMRNNPSVTMLIEGHCDWHGTTEYNLALGERRAKNVEDYLVQLGIAPNRFQVVSKGSLDATPGLDIAAAAKDRRVDVMILQ